MFNTLYYVISVISIWLFIKETNYLHSSCVSRNYVIIIPKHIMQRVIKLVPIINLMTTAIFKQDSYLILFIYLRNKSIYNSNI